MFFGILTLITGLALSVAAAWFAIEGIMAIFAGMPLYGMIMGIVIELGKVVGITWIYRNWSNKTLLKWVGFPLVAVAMGLTSMGIYGLLSKAHLEQTAPVTNNTVQIERLDQRIARERVEITDAELNIASLDATIQVLVDARKISHPTEGSRIVRINQQPQRDALKQIIDESFDSIDEYEDKKLSLTQQINDLELEVGPVKYIAAIVFDDPQENFDKAVRMVIIAFIFVFDPMAIVLLMMGNYTLMGRIGAAPPSSQLKTPTEVKPVPNTRYAGFPAKKEPEAYTVNKEVFLTEEEPEPAVTDVEQLSEPEVEPEPEVKSEAEKDLIQHRELLKQQLDKDVEGDHSDSNTRRRAEKPEASMPPSVLDS